MKVMDGPHTVLCVYECVYVTRYICVCTYVSVCLFACVCVYMWS